MDIFNSAFQWLWDWLSSMLNAVTSWLPDSPFIYYIDKLQSVTFLKYLNWLVPIDTFIVIGQSWLVCISVYYIYQAILRWIKAVE